LAVAQRCLSQHHAIARPHHLGTTGL
jgi:hypothetical protein